MNVFDPQVFLPPPPPRQSAGSCRLRPVRISGARAPESFATNVRFAQESPPPQTLKARGVKKVGLAYERRVIDVLSAIYGDQFVTSPMIYYSRHGKPQRAIPDGLLYLHDTVCIIEVKLAHTAAVWEQLMERYVPLVTLLHVQSPVRAIEVCRSYDPAIDVPHTLITSLHSGCAPGLEVLRWRI